MTIDTSPTEPVTCGSCGCTRQTLNPFWVRERRKALGFTVGQLAALAGLGSHTLQQFESARSRVSTEAGRRLLAALDVTGVELG